MIRGVAMIGEGGWVIVHVLADRRINYLPTYRGVVWVVLVVVLCAIGTTANARRRW